MEVNQVRFGNYTIGNSTPRKQKGSESSAEETKANNSHPEVKSVENGEKSLETLQIIGNYNSFGINRNPVSKDYSKMSEEELLAMAGQFVGEERKADIEKAVTEEFEFGVNQTAEVIGEEFPEISEADRNALAAAIFAQE